MDEIKKTLQYIKTLESTVPEALWSSNQDLTTAREYLSQLEEAHAKEDAAKKKKLDAEKKAKAKRLKQNRSQCEALQAKAFKLREEVLEIQPTVEVEYRGQFADMKFGLNKAIGNYSPDK